MTEHKHHSHNHTVHSGPESHGHSPDHPSYHKPTKEEGWRGRYRTSQKARVEKRKIKDVKIIFNKALKQSRKITTTEIPEHTIPLADEIKETIAVTAERLGKEHVLLDLSFSDERLDHFSQTFTQLHTELHEKYKKRKNLSNVMKRTIVGGNLLVGAAEALTAGGASAVWTDVGHNIADAYVYNEQLNNVQEPHSPKAKSYRRRKAMYTILSASSALLAAKSGIDIVWDTDASADPLAIYTAGGSVIFNAGIGIARYRQMREQRRKGHGHSHHDADVNKHLLVDSASAVLAFVGATAGSGIVGPTAGIISGGLGAKLFFPSEANLRHSYHAHGGEEDHHEHEHHHNSRAKEKTKLRYRRAVAAATSAAVLLAGGIGIKAMNNESSQTKSEKTITTVQPDKTYPKHNSSKTFGTDTETVSSVTVSKGSHLWGQSERLVQQATGTINDSMTDVVVDFATMDNRLSHPDVIQPGEYNLATPDAIQVIYDAKHASAVTPEDIQFEKDLVETNESKPSINDEKHKKRFQRMKTYIQKKLRR